MYPKLLTFSTDANSNFVSEEFAIPYEMAITVDAPNPIAQSWNVERAEGSLEDGGTRTWLTHDTYDPPDNGGVTPGVLGYVYRLNFGTSITAVTARISPNHSGVYGVSN